MTYMSPERSLDQVHFELRAASSLTDQEWITVQTLQLEALRPALSTRDETAIAYYTQWGEVSGADAFREARLHPEAAAAEAGLGMGLRFDSPDVVTAHAPNDLGRPELVGYAYGATVSGKSSRRLHVGPESRIEDSQPLWLREVAVRPDMQGLYLASALAAVVIKGAGLQRPVIAVSLLENMAAAGFLSDAAGMKLLPATPQLEDYDRLAFGAAAEPARLRYWLHGAARKAYESLVEKVDVDTQQKLGISLAGRPLRQISA